MQRTPETFDRHMRLTVANCCKHWIVLKRTDSLSPEYMVTPQTCHSNYCLRCRQQRLLQIRHALMHTLRRDTWRLVTLTYPDHDTDKLAQLKKIYLQYKRLIQRLNRSHHHIKYVRTIELHQTQFPHIHSIFNQYVPQGQLAKHWHDLGGGIVDIRKPPPGPGQKKKLDFRHAARYLTEELEKQVQDPHNLGVIFWMSRCRSITTSRDLKIKTGPSPWKFEGIYDDFGTAASCMQLLTWRYEIGDGPKPQMTDNGNAVFIGPAYNGPNPDPIPDV